MTKTDPITQIARQHLGIETLEQRMRDSLDFHEVSVWGVQAALKAAYEAGWNAAADADQDEEGLRGAEAADLLRFAKAYADLGDAVGEQLADILDGCFDDANPNAIRLIRERLEGLNAEIDDALAAYDAWLAESDEDDDDC